MWLALKSYVGKWHLDIDWMAVTTEQVASEEMDSCQAAGDTFFNKLNAIWLWAALYCSDSAESRMLLQAMLTLAISRDGKSRCNELCWPERIHTPCISGDARPPWPFAPGPSQLGAPL